MIPIPSHLLVVPHAEGLVKNVMVKSGELYQYEENNVETLLTAEMLLRGMMLPKGPMSG